MSLKHICMFTDNASKLNLLKSTSHISQKKSIPFDVLEANQFNECDSCVIDCTASANFHKWFEMVKTRTTLTPVIFLVEALNRKESVLEQLRAANLGYLWNPELIVDIQSNWAVLLQVVEKSFTAPVPNMPSAGSAAPNLPRVAAPAASAPRAAAPATNAPRAAAPAASVPPSSPAATPFKASTNSVSILVVDDSESARQFVEQKLTAGMPFALSLDYAETGAKAIRKCETTKYDVLLLDVMLPDMDGYDICKHLKNTQNSNSLAVMLTSKNGVVDKLKGVMSGCDMYLVKPLDTDQIESLVKKLHERKIL